LSAKSLTANQCNHINARGRRCRMLIASDEESFCMHHLAQSAASQHSDQSRAAELLNSTGDLATVGEVNALLGNVVKRSEACDLKRIADECSQTCRDSAAANSRIWRLLSFLTVHMVSDFHQTRNFHDVFAWEKLKQIYRNRSIARVPKSTS
jgi:hypothetical protein